METRVGKLSYNKKETVGRGGKGTVFKGFYYEGLFGPGMFATDDDKNKKQVAIKRIQTSDVEEDESVVKHEIEVMLKVGHHPHILHYIHSDADINYIYIATELCRGTLEDFFNGKYDGLKQGIINEKEILRQVTKGLAYLHQLKIVHRDIKPSNILIFIPDSSERYQRPQMKLADFGISKILKTEGEEDFTNTSMTNPSGTWGWMAPEVYHSKRFDFKVDVWALGLIFGYTLTGGKHPFGQDLIMRMYRIKQKEPMILKETDLMGKNMDGAFEVIKSMLMAEAINRPTVIEVLHSSFFIRKGKTTLFLDVCKSFFRNLNDTNDEIAQFKKLVNDGTVDVNATTITKDGEEMSPLHLVCRYYREEGLIELVKELLFNEADVNSKANKTHWFEDKFIKGMTPLHLLFYENKNEISNMIDIVRLLLTNNAEVNAKDENGTTPLLYLCKYYEMDNLKDIIQLLVENGADVNAKDLFKYTPLHYLFYYGINGNLKDSAKLLLTSGADVNAKSSLGNTPLHELFRSYTNYNWKDIVQLFLETGADLNVKNNYGETPFHYLCKYYCKWNSEMNESDINDFKSLVLFLVEKGANINTKNKNGETPSDILRKKG